MDTRDFDKRFKQKQDEFDKDWQRARKWFWVGAVMNAVFGLAITGFVVWVVIMLMRYFGVI